LERIRSLAVRRVITLLLAVVPLAALAGCGGGDGGKPPLENPDVLLDSAAAHPVHSADVQGQAKLTLEGSSVLSQPVTIRVQGPYVSGGGERIPSFDWKFNVKVLGFGVGGKVVSTGKNVFISPFGDNYEVGRDVIAAVNQQVAATSTSARDLFGAARNEGNEEVNGVETQHVSAEIEGKKVTEAFRPLRDALGLTHFPTPVGRIGVWVGVDDRTVHKVTLDADFGLAPADRARLGGARGGNLQVEAVLDEINEPQSVHIPGGGGYKPIGDLLLTLQDLGAFAP
jgi:predicted small lipoprotein YifL